MRNLYIVIPLLIIVIYFFLQSFNIYRVESIDGILKYRMKYIPALLIAIPLIYYAWQRPFISGDTLVYQQMYNQLPESLAGLYEYLIINPRDPGYTILSWFSKFAGLDFRNFLLIVAIFQVLVISIFYRKYSCDYYLSILLFVISTDYFSWMWNGMRQFIAVCIVIMAAPFIFRKKYLSAITIIVIASLFHQSALIAIPVVFVVQGKPFNRKTLGVILLAVAVLFSVDLFTDFLDSSLQGTNYSTLVSDYQSGVVGNDNGTNPIRVLVYSVPALLALWGYKIIRYKKDKIIDISTNMSVITMSLYLISMVTSGIFLGRIPIYFSLYSYLLLPWEIRNIFTERSQSIVLFLMIILYIGFYYYQMVIAW